MSDVQDMRARYEHALAEVAELKRALAERARSVAELEERLLRQVEAGANKGRTSRGPAAPEPTESDLARAVAAAEAEKALAEAERERLDERERNIRRVERELAGLRVQLEEEWRRLEEAQPKPPAKPPAEPQPGTGAPPPTPLPQPGSDPDLEPAAATRRHTTGRS